LNAFLAQCDCCASKWEILGIIDEGVIVKPEFFYSIGIFIVNALMKLGVCLSGLHGIRLNLKRLVIFRDIRFRLLMHFMLVHITLLCGVTCAVLTIMLIHFLIMHAVLNVTLYHPRIVLMLS